MLRHCSAEPVVLAVTPAWLVKVQPVRLVWPARRAVVPAELAVLVVLVVAVATAAPAEPVVLVAVAAAAVAVWVSLQLAVQVGTVGPVVLALMPRP
jgi:hypothetical protein